MAQALRRFAREGHPINPKGPNHIAAYHLARLGTERPRAVDVMRVINSQRLEHASSSSFAATFFWAPVANFPNGLPPDVQGWLTSEAEVRASHTVPVDTEFRGCYILEGGCPRAALGRGVRTMTFKETLTRAQGAEVAELSSSAGRDSESHNQIAT